MLRLKIIPRDPDVGPEYVTAELLDEKGNLAARGHLIADALGAAAPGERVETSLRFVGEAVDA